MFTLGMSKYANKLVELGFSDRLCCTSEDCQKYLEYCQENNMVWFDDSYGTIVHKDFHKYFKKADRSDDKGYSVWQKLSLKEKGYMFRILDHSNFIQTIDENEYMITSSPYMTLDVNVLKNLITYPYDIYVIHPNFLNYHRFILRESNIKHPLDEVSYAFTNISDEKMKKLNVKISKEIGIFHAFVKIK